MAAQIRRVVITGASGLIGHALVPFLHGRGCEVQALGRSERSALRWDPARRLLDPQQLAGVEAVVHLAGKSLTGLWTAGKRQAIIDSRRQGTQLLAEALAGLPTPPRVLVSASAVGFYGDRGEALLTEADPSGAGFLAQVCREWEAATQPAEAAGIRVIHLRLGVVVSSQGGAFPIMLRPFHFGGGGRIGSGRQFLSWIALPDLLAAVAHCLSTETLRGPVNAVAPEPVTNAQFTQMAAGLLHRPALLDVPAFVLRAALGEMANEVLLASARVEPRRLLDSGFAFQYPELRQALAALLRHEI